MRISDWSSDVCSSDLIIVGTHRIGALYRSNENIKRTFSLGFCVSNRQTVGAKHEIPPWAWGQPQGLQGMKTAGLFAGIGGLARGLAASAHASVLLGEKWEPEGPVLNHWLADRGGDADLAKHEY